MATDKNTPLLAAGVVIGGIIGGWFGSTLGVAESSGEEHAAAPASQSLNEEDQETMERMSRYLESLQVEMDLLRADFDRSEREAPSMAANTSGGRREVGAPPAIFSGPAPEVSEEQLSAMLDRRDAEKEAERRTRDDQRRKERIDRRMERYQESLGLSDAQTYDMGQIIAEADAARSNLFSEMRESGNWDRELIREQATAMNEKTNTALSGILSTTQMDSYLAEQENSRGFGGGRDRGNRGGRGSGEQF